MCSRKHIWLICILISVVTSHPDTTLTGTGKQIKKTQIEPSRLGEINGGLHTIIYGFDSGRATKADKKKGVNKLAGVRHHMVKMESVIQNSV